MNREHFDEGRDPVIRRAGELLGDARDDAEALLRAAELRAGELLSAAQAAAPDRADEGLRALAIQLTHVVSSAEEDRRLLRTQTETLRGLLEGLRDDIDEMREDIARLLERANREPPVSIVREREEPIGIRAAPAEAEPEPAAASQPREVVFEPVGGQVHVFLENVRTFGQLTALYQALVALPALRGVSIGRYQAAQAHLLLDLDAPLPANAVMAALAATPHVVAVDSIDEGQRTIRISAG